MAETRGSEPSRGAPHLSKRKQPRTFSLSENVIKVLETYKKERRAESLTSAFEGIVEEWLKTHLAAQVTEYYDSLSDEEVAREKKWGEFSETGKWELAPAGFRVVSTKRNAAGELIAADVVCDTANNAKTRTPENAARARLIAKAPALLAKNGKLKSERTALLEALKHIRSVVGTSTEAWHIAEAVSQKAEGR